MLLHKERLRHIDLRILTSTKCHESVLNYEVLRTSTWSENWHSLFEMKC
jgi:hypothetical protein